MSTMIPHSFLTLSFTIYESESFPIVRMDNSPGRVGAGNVFLISTMNDLPVAGYPCYAQRTLGSPGSKHCKSLKGNVWRKVVLTSRKKKRFWGEINAFSPSFIENASGQCLYMEICDEKLNC